MSEGVSPSAESKVNESSRVRGRPFKPGNPGRPAGSKNQITKLLEQLVEGEGQKLAQKMLQIALDGNPRCLEFFMDRLMPPRRGRVLGQQLPEITGVNDIAPAMTAITTQLNSGELTTEEASGLVDFMERYARVILATGLVERIEKIEAQLNQMKMPSAEGRRSDDTWTR